MAVLYRRRPKAADVVRCRYGDCRVTAIRDHGLTLDVVDAIDRPWTVTRADTGCWLVITDATHDLVKLTRDSDGQSWRAVCACGDRWQRPGKGSARAAHREHTPAK